MYECPEKDFHQMVQFYFIKSILIMKLIKVIISKNENYLYNKFEMEIEDLYKDLHDGQRLIKILENLSGRMIKTNNGRLKIHVMENVGVALNFIENNQVIL